MCVKMCTNPKKRIFNMGIHTPSEHMFAEPFKNFRSNPLKILFYMGKYRLNAKIQYIKKKKD